jgi:prevent-host-death family protein
VAIFVVCAESDLGRAPTPRLGGTRRKVNDGGRVRLPTYAGQVSEMAIPEAQEHLADVVHRAAENGSVIYLTDHGHRLAAIVPAGAAARLEQRTTDEARQRLSEAGLLATVDRLPGGRPAEDLVASARHEAGRGRSLAEYVAEGR